MIARVVLMVAVAGALSACAPASAAATDQPLTVTPTPHTATQPEPSYLTGFFDEALAWPGRDIVKVETPQQYYDAGKALWGSTVCVRNGSSAPRDFSSYVVEMYGPTSMFTPSFVDGVSGSSSGSVLPEQSRCELLLFAPDSEFSKPKFVAVYGEANDPDRPMTMFSEPVSIKTQDKTSA